MIRSLMYCAKISAKISANILSFIPCVLRSSFMPPSSSSPPSCSSHSSGRSSSSRKHVLPRGQDQKEQGPSRETITIDKEKAGRVCEGGNEMSIKTKSSSELSSSSTQSALDTLRLIAGSGVRRSKCRAEFLEKLAKSPEGLNVLDKDVAERLRIIIGKEAVAFFRKFIGWVLAPLHLHLFHHAFISLLGLC